MLNLYVVIHPPVIEKKRAFCKGTDILIAAPFEEEEIIRSGTWSTVRFAKKIGGDIIILQRNRIRE